MWLGDGLGRPSYRFLDNAWCTVTTKKWGKHLACLRFHLDKRKLEAYATESATPKISFDNALVPYLEMLWAALIGNRVVRIRAGFVASVQAKNREPSKNSI